MSTNADYGPPSGSAELRVYEGGHAFVAQDRRAFPEIIDFLVG